MDPDYAAFLATAGEDLYHNANAQGSEVIEGGPSDANSAITVNNIPAGHDNVHYMTFTTSTTGYKRPQSYIFEFTLNDLNDATTTQIVSIHHLHSHTMKYIDKRIYIITYSFFVYLTSFNIVDLTIIIGHVCTRIQS
jgi:hypothetical protein